MATTDATPTPTLQAELAPLLNAVMSKQATITASAASGQSVTAHLQSIILNIYIVDKPRNNVERFLSDNKVPVRHRRVCGELCIRLMAVVPVSLLHP